MAGAMLSLAALPCLLLPAGAAGRQPRGLRARDLVSLVEPTTTPPTSAPAAPLPTAAPTAVRPCQRDTTGTYYEATPDCDGYYICTAGTPGGISPCPGGNLYDEAKQMCNWADEVNCHGAASNDGPALDENGDPLPTASPTPAPTGKPNALLEWDRNAYPRGHNKTIIGYYASWQWYDRNGLAAPTSFDFTKITRANFAFFQITEGGDIYGTDMWADPITLFGFYDWLSEEGTVPTYCSWDEPNEPPTCSAHKYEEGLIYLAHQAGAEVYPSIGGWSLSDPFPVMAADPVARANFARQCVELIKSYNFDGIDLDWEYPGYEPHSGTPDDTVNFNLLLDDVRAALDGLEAETGRYYGLTAALPCGPDIIANQDIAHVGSVLTELNLMTYDFHGAWNDKSGVNAPLYDQADSPDFSVHSCVNNWIAGGAPKEKMNIGFPFYGRSFLKAQHLYEPHEGNDETTWHMDEGVPQYYNIMDKMSGLTSVRDDQTMTQYAYGETGMVSYDDQRAICDKTEYAQIHDLNGYIIWELSGDLMPDRSTPLLDAANAKLLDPNLDCASPDLSSRVAEIVGEAHPNSASAGGVPIYYPDHSKSICRGDGAQPEWMEMSSSVEECCDKHFSWVADCVLNSPVVDPPVAPDVPAVANKADGGNMYSKLFFYYASPNGPFCVSDGKQPFWLSEDSMYASEKECCEHNFPTQDCLGNAADLGATVYYPSPKRIKCLSDGKQPWGFPKQSLFDNEEDCCNHNFPSRRDECLGNPTNVPRLPGGSSSNKLTIDDTPSPTKKPVATTKTNRPTQYPTPRPSRRPVTKSPTRYPTPLPTEREVVSFASLTSAGTHLDKPDRVKRPTRHPTPWPTRQPTQSPDGILDYSTPTIQMLKHNSAANGGVQRPKPTRRPTKRPRQRRTKRPTQRPTWRTPDSGASSIASSVLVSRPLPSDNNASRAPRPSKGKEADLRESISSQIQIATKKAKKEKKGAKKQSRPLVTEQGTKRQPKPKGPKKGEQKRQQFDRLRKKKDVQRMQRDQAKRRGS